MVANVAVKKSSLEDWHPADIKAALNKCGWTLSGLADLHGIGRPTMSTVFLRSYPANEKRIADAIGVAPQVIWPSRWNPDGTQKPRGAHALQFNARQRGRNGKAAAEAAHLATGV